MVALSKSSSIVVLLIFLYITYVAFTARGQPSPSPQPNSLSPSPNIQANSPSPPPVIPADSPKTELPPIVEGLFDVTEYGAEPNGKTESSPAFLEAWDAACSYNGDSTFYIPEGTFLLGPVSFSGPCHDIQTLNIVIKGSLKAPPELSAFQDANWIVFRDLQGLNITGGNGEFSDIDARGEVEAWEQSSCFKSEKCKKLITSLRFINVSHGTISNIALSNSKGFHVGFLNCDKINVSNVNITSPDDSPNTDGIHVGKSTNINITSSNIATGDDCVSIGPGSINISVSDVTCGPGHGISIGSLGKSLDEEDVVGIYVKNCTINGTQNGVRVKTWPGAPASTASNLVFEDIVMTNVSNPIIIDQEYCPSDSCKTTEPSLVKLINIQFKNISGTYKSESGVTFLCSSGVSCENIHLINISLNSTESKVLSRQGEFNVKGVVNGLEIVNSRFA